jgi:oxygen-independent coproporphyrinogen III oxidase
VTREPPERASFSRPEALYVHVPICASKCAYCDFFSLATRPGQDSIDELVDATLARAAELANRFGARAFRSLYIGGGTPTALGPLGLGRLLSGLSSRFGRAAEWTVEANPDSLDESVLDAMAAAGVTRVSLGVQSLDRGELELMGRRHGPEAALEAVGLAAKRGFRVSADLMAGLPRLPGKGARPMGSLAEDARALLDAGARHISAYDLSLEEGTPLAARKDLELPGEDELAEARLLLEEELARSGLRRYEVSNYAAPGEESLHNLAYWRMESYLGAGPGAVSTMACGDGSSLRIEEPRRLDGYATASASAIETPISIREAAFETVMMAFRTSFGLDLGAFERRFGLGMEELFGETLDAWSSWIVPGESWPVAVMEGPEKGDNSTVKASIALSRGGMDILNRFLVDCLEELDRGDIGE